MNDAGLRWHVHESLDDLAEAAARAIAAAAARAIDERGLFSIVLAGGSTPRGVYARLVGLETSWERWAIYFGDERCLPAGHAQRNDTMADEVWLEHVPLAARRIHRIAAELGADAAAAAYARELAGLGLFDLVVLGLGEDGHTASLFPGQPTGQERGAPDVLAVHGAPKPPASRVTLSAARLSRSRTVYLLVTGPAKRAALEHLRDGVDLPIRSVQPPAGIDVLVDRAAAPADVSVARPLASRTR